MKKTVLAFLGATLLAACGQNEQKQDSGPAEAEVPGRQLFQSNCAQCHAAKEDRTGPALSGAIGRWGGDTAKIIAFVKNSQQVIATDGENSYAGKLYIKWNKSVMPLHTSLSDAEVMDILRYMDK